MLTQSDIDGLARALVGTTLAAGRAIMAHYKTGLRVDQKSDNSPVTQADQEAEDIILAGLDAIAPGVPVVAEEAASRGQQPKTSDALGDVFFLVDPLDGTRGFIKGRTEFTVNIGLIQAGLPTAGIVYAPALGQLYLTDGPRMGRQARVDDPRGQTDIDLDNSRLLALRPFGEGPLTAVSSRYVSKRIDRALARLEAGRIDANSSIKFCMVARGDAHFYPRFGEISEWDTAAGAAVLKATGGTVTGLDGQPLTYGKAESGYRNRAFVAWGRPDPDEAMLATLREIAAT